MSETLESKLLATVGDVEIFQVPEITIPTSLRWLLPEARPDQIDYVRTNLAPVFFAEQGRVTQSVHTYVLKTPGRVILIDTGVGNQKSRAGGIPVFDMLDTPFLSRLAEIGVKPDDVDLVLCTHMHVDHLGWDAQKVDGEWVPTFPRARYVFAEAEFRPFMESVEREVGSKTIHEDTIAPLTRGGLVDLVPADHRIDGDVRLEPSHGHSPGHVNILVENGGQRAVFIGDVMHNPAQVLLPTVASALNGPAQATITRVEVARRYADTDTIVFGAHFSTPCGGYIRSTEDGLNFVPIELP